MSDLWMQPARPARSAPVWSDQIEGFQDEPETHDELSAGGLGLGVLGLRAMQPAPVWSDQIEIEGFPDAETHDELGAEAGCLGLEGDESDSLTYGSEMRVSEEDESEKVDR
ncbi:hypothetical protein E4U57_000540 [Claviceps arundinis]|uniref:Uncharacterized protein n=1 Tax=Claviceps arundinis TaxID=1623583 RepID=A0ABQ7PCK5_9HYPO|nr:hypothetical protein E4U57_000540 [Claviceps arundinis]